MARGKFEWENTLLALYLTSHTALEILHLITALNIREGSGNHTRALHSEDVTNPTPREFASLELRAKPEVKE